MPVTMKEIADLAGVSIGTVDRALNNRGRINPEVKEKILTIANDLNYRTNTVAKSLALRRKNMKIAVVLHVQKNDFFNEIVEGIHRAEDEIIDFGITIAIYRCTDFNTSEQLRLIDLALEEGANAMVIVPIDHPDIAAKVNFLHQHNFPVVFLAALLEDTPCLSVVRCDYSRSGRIAGNLIRLISGGHGNILAFSPSYAMLGHRQRMEAFTDYIRVNCRGLKLLDIAELHTDKDKDYQITKNELRKYDQVDYVVYCGNTEAGLLAISEFSRPIQSVFYDYTEDTEQGLNDGRITAAILQNPNEQGYQAIMTLYRFLTAEEIPEPEILIENKIILKECID